jgi:hypothetical protein
MNRFAEISETTWTIGESLNIDRVSMEELKLIFNQAEKRLDNTVKEAESIASRTMSIVTLISGVVIALCGYTISIWKGISALAIKDWIAIFGCLYLLGLLIYIISNIITHRYFMGGSDPERLVNSTYEDDEIPRSKMLLLLYINEIEHYNSRITNNSALNHQGWRRYRISVRLLLVFPFVLALLYEVLEWIRRAK